MLQPYSFNYGVVLPNQFTLAVPSSQSFINNNQAIQPDNKNENIKKRFQNPMDLSHNDSNKKQCLESMKLEALAQNETLESLLKEAYDPRKREIIKEYQDLVFLKIYKEFDLELSAFENNDFLKNFLNITLFNSIRVNQNDIKLYTDIELFGLSIMHAALGNPTFFRGAVKLRKHSELIRNELIQRALNNNPIALCCFGEVENDWPCLTQACQLGNPRAQFKVAMRLTHNGTNFVYDNASLYWLSNTPGFNIFTPEKWYTFNNNTDPSINPINISRGWILMKALEDQKNDKASFYMGKFYEHFGNFPQAYNSYTQSAAQYNERAQARLDNPDFKEAYNLFSEALNADIPDKSYKAQRKLGELFFYGKRKTVKKDRLRIQSNPSIAAYWFLLNAERCSKNYYFLGKFFKDSYKYYVKAAEQGYYKAQYILGKAFSGEIVERLPVIQDDKKALHYLFLSLKTIIKKTNEFNLKYNFEESDSIFDTKHIDKIKSYEKKKKILFEINRVTEKYFDTNENYFFYNILNFYNYDETAYLSEDNAKKIALIKLLPEYTESFVESYKSFISNFEKYCKFNSQNFSTNSTVDNILIHVNKFQNLTFKINDSFENIGFFVTCLNPKNKEIQCIIEDDAFPLEKTKWLFYPTSYQEELSSVHLILNLLKEQAAINEYFYNIMIDDKNYLKLLKKSDDDMTFKITNCFFSDELYNKYLNFIFYYNDKKDVSVEEKRKEILELLRKKTMFFDYYIKFFDEAIELVSTLIKDTESYRNMLFVRSNFSQLSINPLISIKKLSWEDQNLTSESKCEDIISEQPRDSFKLRIKILDGSMLDHRLDEIQDLLNQNISKVTIAKMMQVPRTTLSNFIKSRALNVIDESILEHRLGEIENLLNQNASKISIAKTMQVPCTALKDFIKSHDLQ
jgi:hypothetical protein